MEGKVWQKTLSTLLCLSLLAATGLWPQGEVLAAGEGASNGTVVTVHQPSIAAATREKAEWRPMMLRKESQFGEDKVDYPLFYDKGAYGGEGFEYIQGAAIHEDGTVLIGQDMGGAWVSTDFGHTWYTPENKGTFAPGGQACAIDPVDSNVMLMARSVMSFSARYPVAQNFDGIYRSTDKGESWELVLNYKGISATVSFRFFKDHFACYPIEGGDPDTRVWRFATSNKDQKDGGFWSSEDGGKTWTKKSDLKVATYGKKYDLAQHPTERDTVFMTTTKGVWKTTDGGTTWSPVWTQFSTGDVRSLWIDPENVRHMMLSATNDNAAMRGVWETTDDGASWTCIMNDINPGQMAVGAKDSQGRRMIYVHNDEGNGTARIRTLEGEWVIPVTETADPDDWSQQSITGQMEDAFLPHPTEPDVCITMGRAFWWRSEGNGGRVWKASNTNFFGPQIRDFHFDENNWQEFATCAQDYGMQMTTNGGDTFTQTNVSPEQWNRMRAVTDPGDIKARSARALVKLPDPWPSDAPAPVDSSATGRYIMALGGDSKHFIYTLDQGATEWKDWINEDKAVGGSFATRNIVEYSKQNPNIVYAGPSVSMDGGMTWGITTSAVNPSDTANSSEILAVSHVDGNTVYAIPRDTTVTPNVYWIYRSTTNGLGTNWEKIFTAPYMLRNMGTIGIVSVDPQSDERLYTLDSKFDVLLLKDNHDGGEWQSVPLNLRAMYGTDEYIKKNHPTWGVSDIIVDESDSRLIYVKVAVGGAPIIWRGRINEDFTACTWEDITGNAPRLGMYNGLFLNPVTGDLLLGSGNGNFVFPAPDDWQNKDPELRQYKSALWKNLPKAMPTKYMEGTINEADMTPTSVKMEWTPVEGATGYKLVRYDQYGVMQAVYKAPETAQEFTFEGLVSDNRRYNFRVFAEDSGSLTHTSLMRSVNLPPQTPTAIGNTASSISFQWQECAEAEEYIIYRQKDSDESYDAVGRSVYAHFTDVDLEANKVYTYKVSYVNGVGMESSLSEPFSASTCMKAPEGLQVENVAPNSVRLRWNGIQGALEYRLYRDSSLTPIYRGTATSYEDMRLEAASTYEYQVTVVNAGGESEKSAKISAATRALAPGELWVHDADITDRSVKLNWSPVRGAVQYKLFKYDSARSVALSVYEAVYTSDTLYGFTGLTSGNTYCFQAASVDAAGISQISGLISVTTRTGVPDSLQSQAVAETSADLSWEEVSGAAGYAVYRINSGSGVWESVASGVYAPYSVTRLTGGTSYLFSVSAFNASGLESERSRAVEVATRTSRPRTPEKSSVDRNSAVLKWEPVKGAASYTLYRQNSGSGAYEVAAEKVTSPYTVTNLSSSTTYTYRIVAVNSRGLESEPSEAVSFKTSGKSGGTIPTNSLPLQKPSTEAVGDLKGSDEKKTLENIVKAADSLGKMLEEAQKDSKSMEKLLNTIGKMGEAAKGIGGAAGYIEKAVDQTMKKLFKQEVTATAEAGKAVVTVEVLEKAKLTQKIDNIVKAAGQLKESVKAAGLDKEVKAVLTLNVAAAAGTKEVAVELPASLLTEAAAKKLDSIAVDAGIATVEMAPNAIPTTEAQKVRMEVKQAESRLTLEQKAVVGTNAVYDFQAALIGKDNKETRVERFNSSIKVSIPYVLKAGENPEHITVFYLNEKGALENMAGRYDPETKRVLFTTKHFSLYFVKGNTVKFTDVEEGHWAKKYIEAMAAKGIIAGNGGRYAPEAKITRGEFIKLLVLAANRMDEKAEAHFKDVGTADWSYRYIASGVKASIVQGRPDGTFGVDESITREDMAVMLARAIGGKKSPEEIKSLAFADKASISSYAEEAIVVAVKNGLITGKEGNILDPKGMTTRAEAATVIYRVFQR